MRQLRRWARLLCALIAVLLLPLPALAEPDDGTETGYSTAAEAAELLRHADTDVTGNGIVDENDALAVLLNATGLLPELSKLPSMLSGSLLGEKYLDRFSYTGVQQGDGYYRSATICYTLSVIHEHDLTYYVADILLRDLNHFRTAFGKNAYRRVDSVTKMASDNNAIIAINGDYYSWKGNVGTVIRNGVSYRESYSKRQDLCVLNSDGTMVIYAPDEVDVGEILSNGAYQCWSFGPSLLDEAGQPKTEKSQFRSSLAGPNPRSAVGYIEPGHYVFLTVDGRGKGGSAGATLVQLSQIMYGLGCTSAYNLDGGATAVMANVDGAISNQSNSGRRCSDILFIVEDYSVFDEEIGDG